MMNISIGSSGFASLLQLLFIALKLCGVIDWSWWLVLSPTWISVILFLLALLIYVIVDFDQPKHKCKKHK